MHVVGRGGARERRGGVRVRGAIRERPERKRPCWRTPRPVRGARTPTFTGPSVGVSLTRRERDVALFAARGLANREIAERLVLSVRTVESHLAQTYRKFGVKDRKELAEILAPSG